MKYINGVAQFVLHKGKIVEDANIYQEFQSENAMNWGNISMVIYKLERYI